MKIVRFEENPIIRPHMDGRMGDNINGPSLIRVPDWLENPMGRYYLYFGHHQGQYIRLAYADRLEGPWAMYEPGILKLEESFCERHVASPDVHVDDERREIRMYYHGPVTGKGQVSRVALSSDGIHFTCLPEIHGSSYFRVIRWDGHHYALGMPGIFYRSQDGLTHFEQGPTLFTEDMRHTALKLDGNTLSIFYSNAYACKKPRHIFRMGRPCSTSAAARGSCSTTSAGALVRAWASMRKRLIERRSMGISSSADNSRKI